MSSYKHVAKQRKLVDASKERHLSDEDSSDDSPSESEASSSPSGSDSEGSSGEDEDEEEDELNALNASPNKGGAAEGLTSPPAGYPTAAAACQNPVAEPEINEGMEGKDTEDGRGQGNEKEIAPECVVCPAKILKRGRMLEVHLASKDHVRRLNRFKRHVLSDSFPPEHLPMDARSILALLEEASLTANETLTSVTRDSVIIKTPKRPRETEPKTTQNKGSAKEADSVELRAKRAEKNKAKKMARSEKNQRRKLARQKLIAAGKGKAKHAYTAKTAGPRDLRKLKKLAAKSTA